MKKISLIAVVLAVVLFGTANAQNTVWMDYTFNQDDTESFNITRALYSIGGYYATGWGHPTTSLTVDFVAPTVLKYATVQYSPTDKTSIVLGKMKTTFGAASLWDYITPDPTIGQIVGLTNEEATGASFSLLQNKTKGGSVTLGVFEPVNGYNGKSVVVSASVKSSTINVGESMVFDDANDLVGFGVNGTYSGEEIYGAFEAVHVDDIGEMGYMAVGAIRTISLVDPILRWDSWMGTDTITLGFATKNVTVPQLGLYFKTAENSDNDQLTARMTWEF